MGGNKGLVNDNILFSCDINDLFIFSNLARALYEEFSGKESTTFFCIGTDRSSGDSFGPMTGTMLSTFMVPNIHGTLEVPVHARNLEEASKRIKEGSFVVAIDSSLGSFDELGHIKVMRGSIQPGSATGKELPAVGDLSVTLNVGIGGIANYLCLQSASMNIVWKGANVLARAVSTALFKIKKELAGEQAGLARCAVARAN